MVGTRGYRLKASVTPPSLVGPTNWALNLGGRFSVSPVSSYSMLMASKLLAHVTDSSGTTSPRRRHARAPCRRCDFE